MFGLTRFWRSTIGKKVVMAVTGIIGILFVLGHMTGNLLMFKGQGAMHEYALLLRTSMPLLYAVRAVLVIAVVLHAVAAYQLTMLSRAARPADYALRRPQVTTFAARTIRWGGVILLLFIVYHILDLTLGVVHPDFTHLDPYNNVRIGLSNPLVAGFYLLAMAAVGLHLYHGAWSAVRTLGASRPSTQPLKRKIALGIALIVTVGFMIIPIAALMGAFAPAAPIVESTESAQATAMASPESH
ncbi:MAG: succinate dehydrogenase cytochrome b subunit [Gemmatimonadota bacterium]